MIQFGAMPLRQFVALHPDAKVTPEELALLKSYLAPWSAPGGEVAPVPGGITVGNTNLNAVPAEFNGVPFQADFETWKPMSFTDRGDNNTFRAILGNPVAVKAAESGNVSPWPDGTRFAKIAWQQAVGEDGIVYPGKFVQVEFMLKDAELYRKTEGWGFGRWRGNELKPYGSDAQFVTECTGCHEPMSANDFVYTLPITASEIETRRSGQQSSGRTPAGNSLSAARLARAHHVCGLEGAYHGGALRQQRSAGRDGSGRNAGGANISGRERACACHLDSARRSALVRRPHPGYSAVRKLSRPMEPARREPTGVMTAHRCRSKRLRLKMWPSGRTSS